MQDELKIMSNNKNDIINNVNHSELINFAINLKLLNADLDKMIYKFKCNIEMLDKIINN